MTSTIPDFYSESEREIISRWLQSVPISASTYEFKDSAAVAEIVLFPVRDELPRFAYRNREDHIVFSRKMDLKLVTLRDPYFNPQFLFEINWADSGPGVSWPEAYYLSALPGYDGYVLTASQDGPDCYGYPDVALDFIRAQNESEAVENAKEAIKSWWADQKANCEQDIWEAIWGEGTVTAQEADEMASEVWVEEPVEEDEEE